MINTSRQPDRGLAPTINGCQFWLVKEPLTVSRPQDEPAGTLLVQSSQTLLDDSRLVISVRTVERHRTSLTAKLDVHSIVELVRAGIKIGVIRLDD